MKKITQKQIAELLKCNQPTISRYLTNSRDIKLSDALKVTKEFKVPIDIFTNAKTQIKYFGKSFITNHTQSVTKKDNNNKVPKK